MIDCTQHNFLESKGSNNVNIKAWPNSECIGSRFLIKQKSATNKMADYYLKFTKPIMEKAEQYRMGKNKEFNFCKTAGKAFQKNNFFSL